jgi:hypothetical protein
LKSMAQQADAPDRKQPCGSHLVLLRFSAGTAYWLGDPLSLRPMGDRYASPFVTPIKRYATYVFEVIV